jgi:hypothetical protein
MTIASISVAGTRRNLIDDDDIDLAGPDVR